MGELERLLPVIAKSGAQGGVKGLVIRSGKPGGFIAGADVTEFSALNGSAEALAHIQRGQEIFRPAGTAAHAHRRP